LFVIIFGSITYFFYAYSKKLKREIKNRHKIEKRLSIALESTSDGLWDWNLNTNEVYFSPGWHSILGYDENELKNNFSTWENLIHPDDLQYFTSTINNFLNNSSLRYESEFRMIHKNAESINILVRGKKQFNKTGKLQRLVGTIANITDIKNAEMQIRKLSVAIEHSPTTIVITDLEGKIEYANPKFTEMTGYTIEEIKNANPRILNSGKTDKKVYEDLWNKLSVGKTWQGEFINKKKNGDEFIEHAVIAPIFSQKGTIVNYIAIKTDITASKQADLIIKQQNKELEKLNASKDKFFGIIAHDLKNPFQGILGLSNLIVKAQPNLNLDQTMRYVNLINDSAQSAFKLLENLLEWSQAQTDTIEFKPENLKLKLVVKEVIRLLENIAIAKNISITENITEKLAVYADNNMLNTILRNLISNALKFTNKNGIITIKAIENDNEIEISISHATNLFNYQAKYKCNEWTLIDTNFELNKDGIIIRRNKKTDIRKED